MRIDDSRTRTRGFMVRLMLAAVLVFSAVAMTGCLNMPDEDFLNLITKYLEELDETGEEGGDESVVLSLTFPAGSSPKVFTTGWVFGARCVIDTEDGQMDYSDQVTWRGSGSFSPDRGNVSRPSFNGPGTNEIVLSVEVDGQTYTQTYSIQAVSPAGYAKLGDIAYCPNDAHGCLACPHPVKGPINTGSPNVFINGLPAARVGDTGVHAACCGPNMFEIIGGDSSVLINGRPAARIGDATKHCGGAGTIEGG